MSFGGKRKPINKIILGPLHTLHTSTGHLATTDTWWYEPSYMGAINPLSLSQNELESIYRTLQTVRKWLAKHKYAEAIQNAIIRYSRALDERDFATAFIKLWGVLELLTDTIGASYDTAIKRTAFLFEEREYHLQILQHLRRHRNLSIHFDKDNSEIETCLYQLKYFVEHLIWFHLNNVFDFSTLQDAASFLSLPHDNSVLKNQIAKLRNAQKFHGYL
jgi:hypothetical protein